jgi:hypothetical protein
MSQTKREKCQHWKLERKSKGNISAGIREPGEWIPKEGKMRTACARLSLNMLLFRSAARLLKL